jgi:hypothetical protein
MSKYLEDNCACVYEYGVHEAIPSCLNRYFFSFKHREICQDKAEKNVNGSALHAIPCRCGCNERDYVQHAYDMLNMM